MRRVLRRVIPVLATVFGFLVLPAAPAHAWNGPCIHPNSFWSAGYESQMYSSQGTLTGGTAAVLTVHDAAMCNSDTSPTNSSSLWVMTTDTSRSLDFAQSGYFMQYGKGMHDFTAYEYGSGTYSELDDWNSSDTEVNGNYHWYQVEPEMPCAQEALMFFGHVNQTTPFAAFTPAGGCTPNPPPVDWGSPLESMFMAETHYLSSDIPGTSHWTDITATGLYLQDGTWVRFWGPGNWSGVQDSNYYPNGPYNDDSQNGGYPWNVTAPSSSCPIFSGPLCFQESN